MKLDSLKVEYQISNPLLAWGQSIGFFEREELEGLDLQIDLLKTETERMFQSEAVSIRLFLHRTKP
jgi:hypothetical protein